MGKVTLLAVVVMLMAAVVLGAQRSQMQKMVEITMPAPDAARGADAESRESVRCAVYWKSYVISNIRYYLVLIVCENGRTAYCKGTTYSSAYACALRLLQISGKK